MGSVLFVDVILVMGSCIRDGWCCELNGYVNVASPVRCVFGLFVCISD